MPHLDPLEPRRLFAYDLAMTALTVDAFSVPAGSTLTGSTSVTNLGDTPFPGGSVYFALTRKPVNNDPKADDHPEVIGRFGRVTLQPLAPGQSASVSLPLPLPKAARPGTFFFSAVATSLTDDNLDPAADNDFSREDATDNNNQLSVPSAVAVTAPLASVGKPDSGFGSAGTSTVTVQQRLDVVGTVFDTPTGKQFAGVTVTTPDGPRLALVRFNTDGSLDTSYGDRAVGIQGVPGNFNATAVAVTRLTDRSILLVGGALNGDLTLSRFSPDGQPDSAFGQNGSARVPATALVGVGIERIARVVPGPNNSFYAILTVVRGGLRKMAALKLSAAGIDPSFGTAGLGITNADPENPASRTSDRVRSGFVLPDGKLVLVGTAQGNASPQAIATMLTTAGQPDRGFADGGVYLLAPKGSNDSFTTVAMGTNNAILLGGVSRAPDSSSAKPLVAMIDSTGKANPKFGGKGGVLPVVPDFLAAVATLSGTADGGVLLSVRTANSFAAVSSGNTGVSVLRLLPTGAPLSTYGTSGVVTVIPAPITPAADSDSDFDSFASSSAGQVEDVGGGKIRVLASTTTTSSDSDSTSSTTFTATQLVADGVDLSAAASTKLSGSVLVGKAGTLALTVSNLGTLASAGKVTFTVSLYTDLAATSGIAATSAASVLKLSPGTSKKLTLKFKYPSVTDTRGYFLAVDMATDTSTTDIDSTNNRAGADGLVTVGPPYTDLTLAAPAAFAIPAAGKAASLKFAVTNTGNSNASGSATVELLLSSGESDTSPLSLGTFSTKASVKPGKPTTLTLKATLPSTFTLPTGKYLLLRLSGPLTSLDRDPTDNQVFSTSPVT